MDLHAIVAAADGTLTRWGGHPGAVGLELPASSIARFRDELIRAAEGSGAAIARARVRRVDAVVGGRDLGLAAAEAMEALAPFGRGNPPVRLVVPGVELASPVRVGEGRHLQVRLRSDGVHARGIGFRMGERAAGLDLDERHDAVVALEIERWQGLVSPRVSVEAIETLAPRPPLPGQCAQACDVRCPDRLGAGDLRALIETPEQPAAPAPPAGPPAGVRDRRGEGAALSTLAALTGADRGVAAVVADVPRRREALVAALEPGRLGAEVALLGGARCDPGAMAIRLALARGVPALAMLDYGRLAEVDLPEGMHLALVDPPATPEQAAWAAHRAEGRWVHMVWGDAEIAEALRVAEAEWELRPAVTAIWVGLRDGAPRAFGPELEAVLLGDGPISRHPRVAARALAVLAELGLVEVGERGVRAAADPGAPSSRPPSATATVAGASTRRAPSSASLRPSTSSHPSSPRWPRRRAERAGRPPGESPNPTQEDPMRVRWLLIAAAAAVAVSTAATAATAATAQPNRFQLDVQVAPHRVAALKIGKVPGASSPSRCARRATERSASGSPSSATAGRSSRCSRRRAQAASACQGAAGSLICTGITTPATPANRTWTFRLRNQSGRPMDITLTIVWRSISSAG